MIQKYVSYLIYCFIFIFCYCLLETDLKFLPTRSYPQLLGARNPKGNLSCWPSRAASRLLYRGGKCPL